MGPKLPDCTTSALRDGDDGVHQRAALAAIGFRNGDAHQALPAHALRHIERKARIVAALERIRRKLGQRELAHRLGEQLLLFGEFEIHGVLDAPTPIGAKQATLVMAGLVPAIHAFAPA
jgi:hypothetical protein